MKKCDEEGYADLTQRFYDSLGEIEEKAQEDHQEPEPVIRKHYPPVKTGKGKYKRYGVPV